MSTSPYDFLVALAVLFTACFCPFGVVFLFRLSDEMVERNRRKQFLGGSSIPREQLPLTPAEKRALIEVARGNSHKIAAETLGLTRRTVSNQISVVYLKKGVNSITSAMARCLRDGDITLDDILQPAVDGASAPEKTL